MCRRGIARGVQRPVVVGARSASGSRRILPIARDANCCWRTSRAPTKARASQSRHPRSRGIEDGASRFPRSRRSRRSLVFIAIRRPANDGSRRAISSSRWRSMKLPPRTGRKAATAPAPVPAAAPSAPVSVAAAAPSNEIAMNEPKAGGGASRAGDASGAPRALKGSVEAFGAGALMARGAPAANVAAQPPATTTPESVAAQAASADSASREAVVDAAPPRRRPGARRLRGRKCCGAGGGYEHSRVRIIGNGKRRIVAATRGGGAVGAVAGAAVGGAVAASPSDASASADARDNLGTRSICQLDRRQEWNDPAPRRSTAHASAAQRREHRPGRGRGAVGDGVLDRGPQRNDRPHDRRRRALDAHPRADRGQSRGGVREQRE